MPKRGEHIHKRKDGRWEARYKCGISVDGKTLYKSVYAKTYAEVKEKQQKCMAEYRKGAIPERCVPFGSALALWHGNVKKCAVGKHPKSEKLGSTGQAACCARIHSRYFTGGSPSGLRV